VYANPPPPSCEYRRHTHDISRVLRRAVTTTRSRTRAIIKAIIRAITRTIRRRKARHHNMVEGDMDSVGMLRCLAVRTILDVSEGGVGILGR
jgi:hypothetical protein